jgi:hypothetical protein
MVAISGRNVYMRAFVFSYETRYSRWTLLLIQALSSVTAQDGSCKELHAVFLIISWSVSCGSNIRLGEIITGPLKSNVTYQS